MKGLFMGLGIVYLAGFVVFGTYDLARHGGRDVPGAFGYGLSWPLQIARAGAEAGIPGAGPRADE